MNLPPGAIEIDEKRLSELLSGPAGPPAAEPAGLTPDSLRQLLQSPDWDDEASAGRRALDKAAASAFGQIVQQLETDATSVAKTAGENRGKLQTKIAAVQERIQLLAAEPVITPRPKYASAGIRIVTDRGAVPLGGLRVRLIDPRNPKKPLVEGVTLAGGNVVLAIPNKVAEALATDHIAATIEVLTPEGKSIARQEKAVAVQVGAVPNTTVALPDVPALAPFLRESEQIKAGLHARADALQVRAAALGEREAAAVADAQKRLSEAKAVLAAIPTD